MKRPWSGLPINDCGEELVPLKTSFHCLEPHPYLSLGAPYGEYEDPWRLRSGVKKRLILAGNFLQIAQGIGRPPAISKAGLPPPKVGYGL